jgi:hypothetical protein
MMGSWYDLRTFLEEALGKEKLPSPSVERASMEFHETPTFAFSDLCRLAQGLIERYEGDSPIAWLESSLLSVRVGRRTTHGPTFLEDRAEKSVI